MFSETLRQVLKEACDNGSTPYKLGQRLSTSPQPLRRFLKRECGISLEVADKIGKEFGLVICKAGEAPPCLEPQDYQLMLREMEDAHKEQVWSMAQELVHHFLSDRMKLHRSDFERHYAEMTGHDKSE